MNTASKQPLDDKLMEGIMIRTALFCREPYFTDRLWLKRVKGFSENDEADVHMAFIYAILLHHGYPTSSCGSVWYHPTTKKMADLNLEKYKPILDDYHKWWVNEYH